MSSRIFWVSAVEPLRLAFMPRPRSGPWLQDEVRDWSEAGIDTVVSLLEAFEEEDLELGEEKTLCERVGIEFLSFPIRDRSVPYSIPEANDLVEGLVARLREGKSVAIHCRVGIGRSGLIAGAILVKLGVPFAQVFPALSLARGLEVPDTADQSVWVRNFSEGSR
jgi:protein-tyrosine phosphatase